MNTDINFKFDNKYHIELVDSRTGSIKQSGDFHNTVTQGMLAVLLGTSLSPSGTESQLSNGRSLDAFRSVLCGSGTTTPTFNDTALTSRLWSTQNPIQGTKTMTWLSDTSIQIRTRVSFPATTTYVGTVREVALTGFTGFSQASAFTIATHALLTDSEGQQISFNKTDLDILIIDVTLDITLTSTNEHFKFFKKPNILQVLGNGSSNVYGFNTLSYPPVLNTYKVDMAMQDIQYNNEPGTSIGQSAPTWYGRILNDGSNKAYATSRTVRLPSTSITTESYYKNLVVPGIGYFELPNENIFPTYNIQGINVGIGDGSKTDFANPLSYFKANTEVVYKNGIALTRGVDYTVANDGNSNLRIAIADLLPLAKATSAIDITQFAVTSAKPVGFPASSSVLVSSTLFDKTKYTFGFSSAAPLYLEYEEEVTLNRLVSSLMRSANANYVYYIDSGTIFYIDASTDGETYTQVASHTVTNNTGTFTVTFADTTAKYWRIRVGNSSRVFFADTNAQFVLAYTSPNISFATAPAADDIITMDANMDIIMKNSNYVIDTTVRIDFSVS